MIHDENLPTISMPRYLRFLWVIFYLYVMISIIVNASTFLLIMFIYVHLYVLVFNVCFILCFQRCTGKLWLTLLSMVFTLPVLGLTFWWLTVNTCRGMNNGQFLGISCNYLCNSCLCSSNKYLSNSLPYNPNCIAQQATDGTANWVSCPVLLIDNPNSIFSWCRWASSNNLGIIGFPVFPNNGSLDYNHPCPPTQGCQVSTRPQDYLNPAIGAANGYIHGSSINVATCPGIGVDDYGSSGLGLPICSPCMNYFGQFFPELIRDQTCINQQENAWCAFSCPGAAIPTKEKFDTNHLRIDSILTLTTLCFYVFNCFAWFIWYFKNKPDSWIHRIKLKHHKKTKKKKDGTM